MLRSTCARFEPRTQLVLMAAMRLQGPASSSGIARTPEDAGTGGTRRHREAAGAVSRRRRRRAAMPGAAWHSPVIITRRPARAASET